MRQLRAISSADVEPLWNAVVDRLLRGGLELGHLSQPVSPEKTALDRERFEGDSSLARAPSTRRRQDHFTLTGARGAGRHSPLSPRERGFTPIQREMIMCHGQSTFGRSTYTPITSGRGRAWTVVLPAARLASRTRR